MTEKLVFLIRKYAVLLALAAVLCACIAAPYLVPADPDSPVFRVGTLGALLLLFCAFPVRDALRRHSLRALIYGCCFAFIYALCLGVGSEMVFYNGLLPGMGSLVRRFAAPMLATPMLGCLISYFFECAYAGKTAERRIPWFAFFALFTLSYGAVLLAMFPGILNYDFEFEILQYQSGVYEAKHPVFHSMLIGFLYQLGETLFGSFTAGAATYSVFQLLCMAAMYTFVCCFVQRRIPLWVTLLLAAGFALLPFHHVLAISTIKDALFTGLTAVICVCLWEIAEDPAAFLSSRKKQLRFALLCLCTALLRHNAVFVFLPACIAILCLCRGQRRHALIVCAAAVLLSAGVPKLLEAAVGAEKTPSSELLSIPGQQIFRTAEYAGVSDEEYADINSWFSDATFRYRPHCADPTKGGNFDFERYQREPEGYWDMYFKYLKRYPRIYLEAFLANCQGLWHPDDVSHAHSLSSEEWDFVYMKSGNIVPEQAGTIEARSYIPKLKSLIKDVAHHARHENVPLLSHLFRPSFYVFALLLGVMLSCYRRAGRWSLCTLPVWGVFFSLLFSAGVIIRYAYPIMACTPVLFALLYFCAKRKAS